MTFCVAQLIGHVLSHICITVRLVDAIQLCDTLCNTVMQIPMSRAVNYAGLYLCRSSFQIKLMLVVPVKMEHIFSWCIFQAHCFASEMSWRQRVISWMLIYIYICYIGDKWRTKNSYCLKNSWKIWSVYQCEINSSALKHILKTSLDLELLELSPRIYNINTH